MRASRTVSIYRTTLANPWLRRVLLAFLLFNAMEYAVWIAVTLYAFDRGGATTAGLVLIAQLIPAALLAPVASALGDRLRRDRALALGYGVQASANLLCGLAMLLAPPLVVYASAILANCAVALTRPVHNSILPDLADTPEQLTAANSVSSTAEGLGMLIGPVANALLLLVWSTAAVPLAFGLVMVPASLITVRLRLHAAPSPIHEDPGGIMRSAALGFRELARDRDAAVLTVLGGAQFVLLGMLDLFYAVLAIDLLGAGDSGAGSLAAAVGVGALIGAAATAFLVGRARLAPSVGTSLAATGILLAALSLMRGFAGALLLLAAIGCTRTFFDVAGRTLVQRSVRADVLSRVFGVQEGLTMLGTAVGALIVPIVVAMFGSRAAFVTAGAIAPLAALTARSSLRRLDHRATLPDPERMALLSSLPLFRPLPLGQLELLSRRLIPVRAFAGDALIREAEEGDRFYVVSAGDVTITSKGREVARMGPSGFFGEIALLRNVPRTASVTAATDVRLFALEREDFLQAVTGSRPSLMEADRHIERHLGELGRLGKEDPPPQNRNKLW